MNKPVKMNKHCFKAECLRIWAEKLGEEHDMYSYIHSVADEFDCVGTDREQLRSATEELAYVKSTSPRGTWKGFKMSDYHIFCIEHNGPHGELIKREVVARDEKEVRSKYEHVTLSKVERVS